MEVKMGTHLVLTSSLQRLMMQESSNRMGNHPRTQTRSPGATFMSSLVYSLSAWKREEELICHFWSSDVIGNKGWGDSTHLRPVRYVFSTVADQPNGFHTCVRKCSVTHKLWQTLDCILERVYGYGKMLLKCIHCEETKDRDENDVLFLNVQDESLKYCELYCTY